MPVSVVTKPARPPSSERNDCAWGKDALAVTAAGTPPGLTSGPSLL